MKKNIFKLRHGRIPQPSKEGVKIQRISSGLSPYHFINLVSIADNKINPRAAKENGITADIRETLETNPALFWLMSKGILIATENCRLLDRDRVELTLDGEREGIMDGGHNALAIAQYLIRELFPDVKMFKTWRECKDFWHKNEEEIIKRFNDKGGDAKFKFSVPIEIVFPADEDGGLDEYYESISQICTARNTNVQLKQATQDNQVGIYEVLKENLSCADEVIWKSGQAGKIKVEDVISMAVLPLLFLQGKELLPKDRIHTFNPISIYSQKGKCVDFYGEVLRHPSISEKKEDKYILKDSLVKSALLMVDDIIKAYDQMYLCFPDIYNKKKNGKQSRFGGISSVDMKKDKDGNYKKYVKVPFLTVEEKSKYKYPPAFYIPLFCGIRSLMYVDEVTNTLKWRINPSTLSFSEPKFKAYCTHISDHNYDPLKIGKCAGLYETGELIFEGVMSERLREGI
ncbi:MAG: hypothetical protein K2M71_00475 [Duncaniella sp.]|nr:hypothetical protein [Duncaniella sp.]